MSTASPNPSSRRPYQERLLPLLYRRASLEYYRRHPRYALHRARVGPEATLPVPPLVDVLAVYLSQRLPPWFIVRYGRTGVFRVAKVLAILCGAVGLVAGAAFVLARLVWRGLKRTTQSPSADPCYLRQAPVGNASVTLGRCVRFRGFRYTAGRLVTYWQRVGAVRNPCRILLRLCAETRATLPDDLSDGGIARDHKPTRPVSDWPRDRTYCDTAVLTDLPAGDYRIAVGLLDLALGQPLRSDENGRAMIDLGWVRVASAGEDASTQTVAGAAHAET